MPTILTLTNYKYLKGLKKERINFKNGIFNLCLYSLLNLTFQIKILRNHQLKFVCSFIAICFCFTTINAQYTDVINSNRPGFSESPYSVGLGVYQFENSIFFRNTSVEPTFTNPQSLGIDLLFRTSFFSEKLEINTQISYQRDKIAFKNIFESSYFKNGISRATIGAKYLVFEQEFTDKSKEIRSWKRRSAFDKKRFIPSVAIYAGINTNFLSEVHKESNISPKIGVLLQNDLSNDFNIITNFFYDKMGTENPEFSYIITGTYNFSDRWSSFFENQGVFQKKQTNSNIGTGLAYLFTRNLQINATARAIFEGNAQGIYASFGVSYRINRHKDPFTELDDYGNPIKETPIDEFNKKQRSFFSRMFSIFKKKKNINK